MKKILFVSFVLISSICFSQPKETEVVNQLHKKKFTWLINKKYDSLNLLLDDQVKYIHSNGWIQSKQEVMDDLKSGKLNYTAVTVEESTVIFYDKSAIVTGKGYFKGLMTDNTEFNIHLLYTEVYVKSGKNWKLVSRLATKL
jgi:Domain of unknown function (DUF4440)